MAANELVDVVNEQGETIGVVTRREMREKRLPHRCTYVLVFDRQGRILIHLRTSTKDVFPSYWDVAIGGVLTAGETFSQGVLREVQEELGVSAHPRELFPFQYQDEKTTVFGMVYDLVHEGPFHFQEEEIVQGEFVSLSELETRFLKDSFCPDGRLVFQEYLKRKT